MDLIDLRKALDGAMIETQYQPIVRLADRKPIALETLVRLNHPAHGTLPPDDFVPQVEDAGLAAQLTELVAERALQDMASAELVEHELRVTLNFPLDVLLVPDALRRLDRQRRSVGIPADRVVIELTESRPVEDFAGLRAALEPLRADGYSISIDDLSPGMPQIEALLELPFTSVKLDKDVVQHLHESPDMLAFARHILALAKAHNLSVVAEGVEDVATWKRAEALGIHHAQGFLVARPLSAAAIPGWLETWRNQPAFA